MEFKYDVNHPMVVKTVSFFSQMTYINQEGFDPNNSTFEEVNELLGDKIFESQEQYVESYQKFLKLVDLFHEL